MKGDDRTFQTTENIFPLFTYLLVITNPLHLRAFQLHGHFAFIKTVFSAAISFFILHEWMPFCCFPRSYEQSLKHSECPKKKKKKKAPEKSSFGFLIYLLLSLKLHCYCVIKSWVRIKESEGLTNNTQLFPFTSERPAPAFGLLLREGEERGSPLPASWLCFFYLLQI